MCPVQAAIAVAAPACHIKLYGLTGAQAEKLVNACVSLVVLQLLLAHSGKTSGDRLS